MENEIGTFNINDVANDVCAKLIHRHPHIFADVNANTAEEVLKNWEEIKNTEKSRDTLYDKLSSIPPMSPALMRATKVAKKSGEYKSVNNSDIIFNIKSIILNAENSANLLTEEAVGELLFNVSALCGKLDIDPEEALYKKTNSFVNKYREL
jgi:tetrapyrrole methylase family protein/MazG family protein